MLAIATIASVPMASSAATKISMLRSVLGSFSLMSVDGRAGFAGAGFAGGGADCEVRNAGSDTVSS
jgi:hypothetical protein